mmetsp:Transcript_63241/g.150842  ORF Transcript_63241/g.150842 Transcript_63241/m.150842 type:complete len:517 (+) Transcript_63241:114-1664(+)
MTAEDKRPETFVSVVSSYAPALAGPAGGAPPPTFGNSLTLIRVTAILLGFCGAGHVALSMFIGSLDGDPYQWLLVWATIGLPITLAWPIQALGFISLECELIIHHIAYWLFVLGDSAYFASSRQMRVDDLWAKAVFSPGLFVLWGYALQVCNPRHRATTYMQALPVLTLTISLLIRLSWDRQLEGLLLKTWFISLAIQAAVIFLHDAHSKMIVTNEDLLQERRIQELLLSNAYDATMSISRCDTWDPADPSCGMVFNGDFLNKFLSKDVQGQPLRAGIRNGIEHLDILMKSAEEAQWNPQTTGCLGHALISCYDKEGKEFECDVCAVMQPPLHGERGALLCGVRIVGERRPINAEEIQREQVSLASLSLAPRLAERAGRRQRLGGLGRLNAPDQQQLLVASKGHQWVWPQTWNPRSLLDWLRWVFSQLGSLKALVNTSSARDEPQDRRELSSDCASVIGTIGGSATGGALGSARSGAPTASSTTGHVVGVRTQGGGTPAFPTSYAPVSPRMQSCPV